MSPDNCLTAQTYAPATDRNLESDCVMNRPPSMAQENSPVQPHVRAGSKKRGLKEKGARGQKNNKGEEVKKKKGTWFKKKGRGSK